MAFCLRLELTGRPCVVFGGGTQGLRRAKQLTAEGAEVTVYSPSFGPGWQDCPARLLPLAYAPQLLDGAFLAAAATDDAALNRRILVDCAGRGVVGISSTADPDAPFHPMAARPFEGGVTAVSMPESPALAALAAGELSQLAETRYAGRLNLLAAARRWVRIRLEPRQRRELLRQLAALPADQLARTLEEMGVPCQPKCPPKGELE